MACVSLAGAAACQPDEPRFVVVTGPIEFGEDNGTTPAPAGDGGGGGAVGFFTKAYDANDPPIQEKTASALHAEKAGPPLNPKSDCMVGACHGPGAGTAPKWAFGGYAAAPGGAGPAAKGEVIVTGDTPIIAKIDDEGFFWAEGTLAAGAKTAIRMPNNTYKAMNAPAGAGCSAAAPCHGTDTNKIDFK